MARMARTTEDNPTKLPVQLNINIPWDFKKFLEDYAAAGRESLRDVVFSALTDKYGADFEVWLAESPYASL